jgi:hypothetical protein
MVEGAWVPIRVDGYPQNISTVPGTIEPPGARQYLNLISRNEITAVCCCNNKILSYQGPAAELCTLVIRDVSRQQSDLKGVIRGTSFGASNNPWTNDSAKISAARCPQIMGENAEPNVFAHPVSIGLLRKRGRAATEAEEEGDCSN